MAPGGHATATAVIIANIALTATATLITLLRLAYRLLVTCNLGTDDALITIALLCSIAQAVASCYEAHYAVGIHTWLATERQSILSQKALWVAILTYNGTLFTGRLSILFQYRRIFIQRWFLTCLYILMAIVSVVGLETVLESILACVPVSKFWNASEPGYCQPKLTIWFTNGGINIVVDSAIAILPLPILARLKVSKQKRTALMIIFALGGITCLVSGVRIYILWVFSTSSDPLYDSGPIAIWSTAEINTVIIMACLPALRGVYARVLHGTTPGSSTSSPVAHELKDGDKIKPIERFRFDSETTAVNSTLSKHEEQDLGPSTAQLGFRRDSTDRLQSGSLRPPAPQAKRSWREHVPRLGSDLIGRVSPMPSVDKVARVGDQTAQDSRPESRGRLIGPQQSGSSLVLEE